jgi:hypothetical protein
MKRNFKLKLFIVSTILIAAIALNVLHAADPEPGSMYIKKTTDFKVTGNGSAANWQNTEWIDVVQQGPDPSPYTTKVKVLYSEKGIYFLFDCVDKKLTSTMKGDFLNIFTEDVVEVFLWPDESFPLYFEYELSPLNYELPILIPNIKGKINGWQPWHYEGERRTIHETSVTGGVKESMAEVTGWMAEFFIPFKLLNPLANVPPVSGTKWRANMYRIDYDHGTTYFTWQKVKKGFHEYYNYGTFIFE